LYVEKLLIHRVFMLIWFNYLLSFARIQVSLTILHQMDGRAQVLINKKKIFTNQQIDSYEEETRGARRDAGVAQTIQ